MELVAQSAACASISRLTGAGASTAAVSSGPAIVAQGFLRKKAANSLSSYKPGGLFSGNKLATRPFQSSYPRNSRRESRSLQVFATKQTFSSFDDMIKNSEVPVLVDFYATWCGPCQYMVPILGEVGATMKDEISVVKIDSEKYPNLATQYDIQALPTFVLFKNGNIVDRFEGALPAGKLIQRIRDALSSCKAGV